MNAQRLSIPADPLSADNNIRHQYPIHRGKWVRHPQSTRDEASFSRFSLAFTLESGATIDLHVSADNRFELFCDGQFVGMGPDRSDVEHWSFHSYRLTLAPGEHRLVAEVYFLGLDPAGRPYAQTCIEPGFVLLAENSPVDLNTGSAPWRVTLLGGVKASKASLDGVFFVVGPDYTIDAAAYFAPAAEVDPVVVRDAGRNHGAGTILPGWKLYPTRLPEQLRRPIAGGRIRSVSDIGADAAFPPDDPAPHPGWQAFVEGRSPVQVPANSRVTVLYDLEQYHTAFPQLTTVGGAGASVTIHWAESCFVRMGYALEVNDARLKGNRNVVEGKFYRGNGDTFLPDGPRRTFRSHWWRAGRYLRIMVQTLDQPLTLERLTLEETRLPLENQSEFHSSDARLSSVIDIAVRGIQMCAHETYMDCPYYEQLMYVGDTRLQMLTSYVMSSEDRLNQRGIELFDWSRQETGFVHERYPSQPRQLSCTFAMIWVLMLRDYAWWRSDATFVKQRIKGMRCLLEEFKALPDTHAPLLPALPGWSFMDWVKGLSFINSPGPNASVSAVVNLLFLNTLNAAAQLEQALGEPHLAQYNREWARRIAAALEERFWDESRGLFADDPAHTQFSEHAQCLALLSGWFPQRSARCFESLITAPDLLRTTVYFSFYLLEVMAQFGRGDLVLKKLDFWKEMVDLGLKTPLEMPEPARSDCHAWSSHPLFHLHASVAGIRPDAPGFASVRIAPQPGALTQITSVVPHPAGKVELSMKLVGEVWQTKVALPPGVEGTLHWFGRSYPLAKSTTLSLPGKP